ncbi:MAG: hypothetical protein J3Q66DRAFT_326185 [Benniella sp.]|nr:MAG: hypothetical protein J3Q66DRAFT_326185 [Benniella sp.]
MIPATADTCSLLPLLCVLIKATGVLLSPEQSPAFAVSSGSCSKKNCAPRGRRVLVHKVSKDKKGRWWTDAPRLITLSDR